MTDRHDYVALEWVKGEIAETLKQARQALESYVENTQDSTPMRFCLTYVHQVQGTLQMVEFYGAALLAEEMEQLAQALIDGRANNQREALEVLMQAVLQLPLYLDRIQSARRDLPMALLPLLNDLRAARGEKLLSETSLFAPDLSSQRPALSGPTLARLRTAELPVLLRKMRQMLQAALAGIIRGQDLASNLGYMARVFARLESLCQDAPLEPLWKIASALVEGLANGSVVNGSSVRNLLREVDKELKRLLDEGADGFNQAAPDELVKNLLFYIAKAPAQSPRIRAIKEQYRLDEALPDSELVDEERARLAGPDRGAMRSVVTALCEELVRVKDSLDLFVRSDRHAIAELDSQLAPLKQIADTLAVLGFGQPRKVIIDQIDVIHGLSLGQREPSDAVLMDIAGALLYVEATLAGMVGPAVEAGSESSHLPTTDVTQIHQLVIKEARTGLEQAKDAIIEFIASQWNHEHLARVPELLTQARGGLAMIPLPRAAALLEACNRYIQEQLLARKAVPNWQSLDTLADAITSVEYYLERLSEDHAAQGDLILDVAEESLENLGYSIKAKPSILDRDMEEDEPLAPLADPLQEIEVLAAEGSELEQHLDPDDNLELNLADLPEQADALAAPAPMLSGNSELLVSDDNWSFGEAAPDATEPSLDLSLDAPLQWEDAPVLDAAPPATVQTLASLDFDELEDLPAAGEPLAPGESEPLDLSLDAPLELADLEDLPPALPGDAEATAVPSPSNDELLASLDFDELENLPAAGALPTPAEGEPLDLSLDAPLELGDEALPSFDLADLEELPPVLPGDAQATAVPSPSNDELLASLDFDELENLPAPEPIVELDAVSLDEFSAPLEWDEAALAELGLPEVDLPSAPLEPEPPAPAEQRPLSLAEVMATPVPAFNPPAQDVPPSLLPPPADEEPVDDELREVFIEEAGEVLETLGEYLPRWRADSNDRDALGEVRRAFHTLKGSGRMVRALVIGELSWSIENLLNRVLDRSIQADEPVLQIVDDVVELLPALVEEYAAKAQRQRDDVDRLAAIAHALAKGQSLPRPDAPAEPVAAPPPPPASPVEDTLDPQLLDIFRNEAENHLDTLAHFLTSCDQLLPRTVNDDLQRALHTLKGSAHMAGILPIAEIATPLEKLAKEYKTNLLAIDLSEAELLREALRLLRQGVAQLDSTPLAPIPGTQPLLERIAQLHQERLGAAASACRDDQGEGRDPQMISLFLAEGMDILLDAEDLLRRWREHPGERQELGALLEELSTLGRGAEMAELPQIEQLCEALLDVYGAVDEGSLPVDERFFSEAESAHEALISMMDQVAAALEVTAQPAHVRALHALLQDTVDPQALAQLGPDLPPPAEIEETAPEPTGPEPAQAAFANMPSTLDEEMVSIFLEEAVDILDSAGKALERWLGHPENPTALLALQRDLHTLKGGARMAEISPIGDLAHELESLYEGLQDRRHTYSPRLGDLLHGCHDCLARQVQQLQVRQPLVDPAQLIQDIRSFRLGSAHSLSVAVAQALPDFDESPGDADEPLDEPMLAANDEAPTIDEAAQQPVDLEPFAELPEPSAASEPESAPRTPTAFGQHQDPELVEIFLEEGFDILDSASAALQRWMEAPDNTQEVEALQRDLHTLKGGARMAEIGPIGDLAHELEFIYEGLCDSRLRAEPALFSLLQSCHDRLAEMLEAVRDRRPQPDGTPLIEAIQAWRANPDERLGVPEAVHEQSATAEPLGTVAEADILDIFLEEADDLLEAMETSIGRWEESREDGAHIDDVLRILHTLKGGARLAGQKHLGDIAHDLEQYLVEAQQQGSPWPDSLFLDVQSGYEGLQVELDQLRQQLDQTLAADMTPAAPPQPADGPQAGLIVAASVQPTETVVERVLPFVRRAEQAALDAASRRAPQELVKVPAELLEDLVNLAGETSIFRGRVEQQVSDFSFTLTEMEATIERVRDQLRRLDIETQAQILSRYQAEAERAGYEEFDPLEMDRHSQLQQLSRALFESASDLLDLKETLAARNRDAETLLLQQARVNTELQEGLMRTRMVPFDRLVPRLRRIVRQVASELGKQVDFIVGNAEGEMDRTVLERMVAPLEHMLRNAVDHGIESAEQRLAAGKSHVGSIRLNLSREGGDIVLTLADDGAGIRLEAVRRKAIERGMMDPEADLSDHEVLQFILEPGFSTADKVTQISGRGVGMDVVHSEVKQLGGSMSIDSTLGAGTRFLIRLPFTVSVNRALMVLSGEDLYAIPLNTIEGIVRVSPYELETYYQPNAPRFEYASQEYELRYLGDLLNNGQRPKLVGHSLPLPVILVRSSEHAVAVQVDALVGSREIVVKSLGPQFAGVHGISGATILGDGRVVVILDLLATIRVRHAHLTQPQLRLASTSPAAIEAELERPPLVMVVDDSVTVRKVTSRLLERNGMNVVTAKDGVDAITLLQEHCPDIMLLDIEMPRMDGFEVATLVRHDARLKDLPIIMITSRTGEKHRERAIAIGVNEYLGKPYQESLLLESIQQLVKRT